MLVAALATFAAVQMSLPQTQIVAGPLSGPKGWFTADNRPGIENVSNQAQLRETFYDLVVKGDGTPCAAWTKFDANGQFAQIYFGCYDKAQQKWVGLQNSNAPDVILGESNISGERLSLALYADDRPALVWEQIGYDQYGAITSSKIAYTHWNGQNWRGYTGARDIVSVAPLNFLPSLAINPTTQRPVVTFQRNDPVDPNKSDIMYREFNGNFWVGKQGFNPDHVSVGYNGQNNNAAVAVGADGVPHVTWSRWDTQSTQAPHVLYRRWNGQAWKGYLGSVDVMGFDASQPDIAVDKNNQPGIVFAKNISGDTTYVGMRKWNGQLWRSMSGQTPQDRIDEQPITSAKVSWPEVGFKPGGRPVVTWTSQRDGGNPQDWQFDLKVASWNGSAWIGLDGSEFEEVTNDAEDDINASLSLDQYNRPHVLWVRRNETTGTFDAYYSHWL